MMRPVQGRWTVSTALAEGQKKVLMRQQKIQDRDSKAGTAGSRPEVCRLHP
jgi:hypothetical protein